MLNASDNKIAQLLQFVILCLSAPDWQVWNFTEMVIFKPLCQMLFYLIFEILVPWSTASRRQRQCREPQISPMLQLFNRRLISRPVLVGKIPSPTVKFIRRYRRKP